MLVFISDLHLRDTPELTIPEEVTESFLKKTLIPEAMDARAKEITLVFLGDMVDINRSPYWVDPSLAGKYRPWSNWLEALADLPERPRRAKGAFDREAFERHIIKVIERIAESNRKNYALWKAFRNRSRSLWGKGPLPEAIRYIYIPGNHDRLVQYSARTRKAIVEGLGISSQKGSTGKELWDSSKPFDWMQYFDDYRVLAFHGHAVDPSCFGGGNAFLKGEIDAHSSPLSSPYYLMPCLGDAVTVLLGNGLIRAFTEEVPGGAQSLDESLAQIDLVRPQSASILWLQKWGLQQKPAIEGALDRAMEKIARRFLEEPFVRWSRAHWLTLPESALISLAQFVGVFRNARWALWLFEKFAGDSQSEEKYRKSMAGILTSHDFGTYLEDTFPRARYFVSGHTHRPTVIPLRGETGSTPEDEEVYFNTGTWLDVIEQAASQGGFARRNQITYVAFYNGEERSRRERKAYWEYAEESLREGASRANVSRKKTLTRSPQATRRR
ncbi:MAG TPA: hypothetical protein VL126_02620 [Bacteroidota bacterium]|nr:hypothetical protein [Bacteroidota bacterium]